MIERCNLECINCGEKYSSETVQACKRCRDLLNFQFDYEESVDRVDLSIWMERPPSVWSYRELLPIQDLSKRVTLMEGGTGLHVCSNLGRRLGLKRLYVKNEGENPTGSFKDRGMTVGVSRAVEIGKKMVACASTGNTSSSLSAYSAKANLECLVLIPHGKVALGKLAQAIVHGARIVEIDGDFDDALRNVLRLTELYEEIYLLNSVNPYRIEGQKTLGFEIWAQLEGELPDKIIIPVGNGGNLRAVWKGFSELKLLRLTDRLPQMIGIQAEGASPIAQAYRNGVDVMRPIEEPKTVATAIRIGAPANWRMALGAVRDSKGVFETVTDGEILEAQRLLASLEGLFVEPASAASIAGLKKLVDKGRIYRDESILCIVTGHGLKDTTVISENLPKPFRVGDNFDEIVNALGLPARASSHIKQA